ncbi:hypothetical protein CR513_36828, partial [Mucuna pruriens]
MKLSRSPTLSFKNWKRLLESETKIPRHHRQSRRIGTSRNSRSFALEGNILQASSETKRNCASSPVSYNVQVQTHGEHNRVARVAEPGT